MYSVEYLRAGSAVKKTKAGAEQVLGGGCSVSESGRPSELVTAKAWRRQRRGAVSAEALRWGHPDIKGQQEAHVAGAVCGGRDH